MRADPTNNTLLNTRTKVFGAPNNLYDLILQALFTGYMLRFDSSTVEAQLSVAVDENDYTRSLFNRAIKELPVKYPELHAVWSSHV